ncbi:MAG: LPS assembly protein LptD [Proteobacteria bacterium]|nr:LPS assembly protein LptD [Pseudomonadota bacterium]
MTELINLASYPEKTATRKSGSFFRIFCISLCHFVTLSLCHSSFAVGLDANSPKTITADKIEYNVKDKTIRTVGKTEVTNASGQRMTLQDSYITERGINASGRNVSLLLNPQTHISAATVAKVGDITKVTDAIYTACWNCDPNINAWEISAAALKHDKTRQAMDFENMVFWVYNVPVIWLPFLYDYPDPTVRHKTGFLYPSFNTTNGMGTQINIPFYISISDSHDLTLTGSYLTNENPLWQVEHRLNINHGEFRTTGSYTYNREGVSRWHAFNKDLIEMGDHARLNLFLQRASDKTYLQKYGFYGNQPYLDSGARAELFAQTGYVTATAHIFQELRATNPAQTTVPSGDILPNIHGVYQTESLFADTYLSLMGDILGVQNFSNGSATQRAIGAARVVSPWTLPLGNLVTASASARYDVYSFINTAMLNGATDFSGLESRFLPSAYAEWSLPFLRAGENWIQTITPRARITTMMNRSSAAFAASNDSAGALLSDASLFSDNRYAGYDLWQSGTYADYGLNWSAFDRDNRSIEAFVGQTYDFSEPIATDPNSGFRRGASDYVGRVYLNTGKWLSLANRFRFAENNLELRHLESMARIGDRNFINLGYIWAAQFQDAVTQNPSINEVVAGFGIYLTGRVSLKYNITYNITDTRAQLQTGGLYYEHPCYNIALEYMHDAARKGDFVGKATIHLRFGIKLGVGNRQ